MTLRYLKLLAFLAASIQLSAQTKVTFGIGFSPLHDIRQSTREATAFRPSFTAQRDIFSTDDFEIGIGFGIESYHFAYKVESLFEPVRSYDLSFTDLVTSIPLTWKSNEKFEICLAPYLARTLSYRAEMFSQGNVNALDKTYELQFKSNFNLRMSAAYNMKYFRFGIYKDFDRKFTFAGPQPVMSVGNFGCFVGLIFRNMRIIKGTI